MIIELLGNIFLFIYEHLAIEIPKIPEIIMSYIEDVFDYMSTGASILGNYVPLNYIMPLFFIIVTIDVGITGYKFLMWVIKKIPLLNMK